MSAVLQWCAQNPLVVVAGLFLLFVPIADLFQRSEGMDTDADEAARRILAHFDEPAAAIERIRARMVEDGLIRDADARTRLGDSA